MLETVIKHGIIFYVMGAMAAVGVTAKLISYITARQLVKAAGDIQKSNQRLMRLIKAKFEHASMVSDKVQNVEAFVQKYLYEYKVFGGRFNVWRSFPLKMAWLIVAIGISGMLASYSIQGMAEQTFRYGAFAVIYAVALVSIHILSDEKMKLDAAKNYMVEYLENVCAHRYEKAHRNLVEQVDTTMSAEVAEEQNEEVAVDITENAVAEMETKEEIVKELQMIEEAEREKERNEHEMRIRAILQEFLA